MFFLFNGTLGDKNFCAVLLKRLIRDDFERSVSLKASLAYPTYPSVTLHLKVRRGVVSLCCGNCAEITVLIYEQ